MLLPHNTTVAVADGRAIRIFRNAGTEIAPRLEMQPAPALHPHGHASGGHHHSSAANPDAKTLDEDAFAGAVVHWLNAEVLAGRIQRLAVVAPPRSLGEMRPLYHAELKKRLVTEIGREMSGASTSDIEAELRQAR